MNYCSFIVATVRIVIRCEHVPGGPLEEVLYTHDNGLTREIIADEVAKGHTVTAYAITPQAEIDL